MLNTIRTLYNLGDGYELTPVEAHKGGRNLVYICTHLGEPECVIRVSMTGDREEEEYLAEAEYVHYLALQGASVADVIPSVHGKQVEKLHAFDQEVYITCFEYAKGMLISDNGYRYREGQPLAEYFYNTGKTLGRIHKLSKRYDLVIKRRDYYDKYNMTYIDGLLSEEYIGLKAAIAKRLDRFRALPKVREEYGLVHFDFSDGNYHIDMKTGEITVFDFDNCMYCWYMFDLANLWTHGVGWFQFEEDRLKRMNGMKEYFNTIIEGYRSETNVTEEMLAQLPLFIDMVLIENIVDECECCKRAGENLDYEDIEEAAECLINDISYAGFFS